MQILPRHAKYAKYEKVGNSKTEFTKSCKTILKLSQLFKVW